MRGVCSECSIMEGPSNRKALATPQDDAYKEVTVDLELDKGQDEKHAENTLVGKILANKELNRGAVKSIITKAWGNLDGLKIVDLGPNQFMFMFKGKEEM